MKARLHQEGFAGQGRPYQVKCALGAGAMKCNAACDVPAASEVAVQPYSSMDLLWPDN